MENKINVEKFVKEFKAKSNQPAEQNKLLAKLNIKQYVSFNVKVAMANKILNEHFVVDETMVANTPKRYLAFLVSILTLYTDLDMVNDRLVEQYDLLRESEVIDVILKNIGNDMKEYKMIWDSCYQDYTYNTTSLPFLYKKSMVKIADALKYAIDSTIDHMDDETKQKIKDVIKEF